MKLLYIMYLLSDGGTRKVCTFMKLLSNLFMTFLPSGMVFKILSLDFPQIDILFINLYISIGTYILRILVNLKCVSFYV